MLLTVNGAIEGISLVGAAGVGALCSAILAARKRHRIEARLEACVRQEKQASNDLCFSTLEALAYTMEANDPFSIGHLSCVQHLVVAVAQRLKLPEEESAAVRASALLHTIGRLGVPEHILHKVGALTPEEQEKLRDHPLLAARILASIPFPWPVADLVRSHTEHWDGAGYPDGLQGDQIPIGARILAIASAYSGLLRGRSFRRAYSPEEAMEQIERRSGTHFDPKIVEAFRSLALDHEGEEERQVAWAALDDIAAAQRETLGLFTLLQSISGSLHLEAVSENLLHCVRDLVPCAACVLFLPEDDGEFLRAHAALGVNERHLLGSFARVGTYLTGRSFTRGEITCASFLANDLILRDVSEEWTPMRSTLIVPLVSDGRTIGTLNLYAEEPLAFGLDAQRVMRLVAAQAATAIDNARQFAAVQETAYTDALTGLRNARYLREYLERELNRSSRDKTALAVLNIDLDNFKPINDRFGHARGDQTLREVAAILGTNIRNYDLAARYAGDEFVVVLSGVSRAEAEAAAAKLKEGVEQHGRRLVAQQEGFPMLGISVGIALFPEDASDMQGLLCRSDAAMYTDKQTRKATRPAA